MAASTEVKMTVIDGVRFRPEHVERAKQAKAARDKASPTTEARPVSSTRKS